MARKRNLVKAKDDKSEKLFCYKSPRRERDVLNDGLLNLYKRELDGKKEKCSISQDESTKDNKFKENLADSFNMSLRLDDETRKSALSSKLPTVYLNEVEGIDETPTERVFSNDDLRKEKSSGPQAQSNKSKELVTEVSKPSKPSKRKERAVVTPKISSVTFDNIGGMDETLDKLDDLFMHYGALPFYRDLKIAPQVGILLHGPSGCGKTFLVHAISGEIGIPLIEVSGTELVHGISGESENKIRNIFAAALATGRCILFIDEIDAIARKRETNENAMMSRMVSQLLKSFDELNESDPDGNVVVIAATNMPDSLDSALRRGFRFTHEIAVGIPDEDGRFNILKMICEDILPSDDDIRWLAHNTPGYVGADLKTLAFIAKRKALKRIVVRLPRKRKRDDDDEPDPQSLSENQALLQTERWFKKRYEIKKRPDEKSCTLNDFKVALKEFIPSSRKEGFGSVPLITWDQIGSYEDIKEELQAIVWHVKHWKFFEENDYSSNKGILLYGPKGCGKTLLAKAVANEGNINFLAVNGPELLSMYVGESERAIRKCFQRAQSSAPCIIFFDEFDALCPPRSSSKENAPVERVVNQLLTETCGTFGRKQVFLIAATNRLDKIDSAMLRPGRFEKVLYVGLPTPAGRVDILKSYLKRKNVEENFDVEKIAFDSRCENFSGADLSNLVDEAFVKAVKEKRNSGENLEGKLLLCMKHFESALATCKPSISEQERKYYETICKKYSKD